MLSHFSWTMLILCAFPIQRADSENTLQSTYCQGDYFSASCGEIGPGLRNVSMVFKSMVLYGTTDNPDSTTFNRTNFCAKQDCQRTIRTSTDPGLNDNPLYKYFYEWLYAKCHGKTFCNGTLPTASRLTGVNEQCLGKNTYFSSVLLSFSCDPGPAVLTASPPPETTVAVASTAGFDVDPSAFPIPVASGTLSGTDKIILAVTICVAIVILFCLLILLYCCDKWRRDKKKMERLLKVGKPSERTIGIFDEIREYATNEAWKDETDHLEALGEYTGVKPEEVFTIDRRTMDRRDLLRQDGAATLQREMRDPQSYQGSMTTLTRAAQSPASNANKEYVNHSYIPSTFERMDILHY